MSATGPRKRRDPDEARAHILDAAERVFAARGPDAAGLKDVAREAAVSSALVTHYFGAFETLVEAVMERRAAARRTAVVALVANTPTIEQLVDTVLSLFAEPVDVRLVAWAWLSGRMATGDFFPARVQGLRHVADALEKHFAQRDAVVPRRDRLESAMLVTITAGIGYAIGRTVLHRAFGHAPSAVRDAAFREALVTAVRSLVGE